MDLDEALSRQAATLPDRLAVTDTLGNAWSFSQLDAAASDLCDHLQQAGVQACDRVLLLVENCAPAVAAIFACARMGASVIPVNARLTAAELDRVIAHATPAAILATAEVSHEATVHADRLGAKAISGQYGSLGLATRTSTPDPILNDVAVILYTTGTTGTPKGVMLTHSNALFGGRVSAKARNLSQTDIVYGVLPVSHVFGLTSILIASTLAGATIRMTPRFDPKKLLEALSHGITVLAAVPQMLAKLMHYAESQGHSRLPAADLHFVSAGAAPLDLDWKQRTESYFNLPVQNGYGMTETSAGICLTQHTVQNNDISVGRPLPGVEVKIDTTAPGSDKEIGEILVQGGNVMKGYFRNPDATSAAFTPDGWLRTGDLGYFDKDNNLHIKGRSKELIIHGGFNIYPPEVEAALNDHPKVIQSAVIGKTEHGDETVCAFVEVSKSDPPDLDELHAYITKSLAPYKRPKEVVLTEKLPATVTGKILKHRLFSDVIALDS